MIWKYSTGPEVAKAIEREVMCKWVNNLEYWWSLLLFGIQVLGSGKKSWWFGARQCNLSSYQEVRRNESKGDSLYESSCHCDYTSYHASVVPFGVKGDKDASSS